MDNCISDMPAFVRETIGQRSVNAHKGDFGNLLCICGSDRYRGAAQMAVRSALRCGVGLLRLASVEKVVQAVSVTAPECICVSLNDRSGVIADDNRARLVREVAASTAVLCGCGMTDGTDTANITLSLLENADCPLVLDADALNVLRGQTELLLRANAPVIVTPHPGEMARLCGTDIASVQKDREATALAFAKQYGCVTVLKGSGTVVASPDGRVYVNRTGNPGLARGGSGDCLAGMIAALAARAVPAFEAAVCGVYLHGLAADLCAEELTAEAMLPSDLASALPKAFRRIGIN